MTFYKSIVIAYTISLAIIVIVAILYITTHPIQNPNGAICITTSTFTAPNIIINHTKTIMGNITTMVNSSTIAFGSC